MALVPRVNARLLSAVGRDPKVGHHLRSVHLSSALQSTACEGEVWDRFASEGFHSANDFFFAAVTIDEFREDLKLSTSSEETVLVLSYDRHVLGQTGSGHFSPLAAYDSETDKVGIIVVREIDDTFRFLSWMLLDSSTLHIGSLWSWRTRPCSRSTRQPAVAEVELL